MKEKLELTHEIAWEQCLEVIKDNVNDQSFKTWFEPIHALKLTEQVLTIEVPSQFFYEWLEEHYIDILSRTIRRVLGPEGRLEYSVIMENGYSGTQPITIKIPTRSSGDLKNPPLNLPVNVGRTIRNPFILPGLKKVNVESQLNTNYTFDNFVEGDCNRLARSAGYAVANKPGGTSFNPLLLYGASGLGKSHLAHAIGIEIKKNFSPKTVLYVTSDRFTNQFTESVRGNAVNDFVHFYQEIDVLLIDDIHDFAGKEKTQEVFFHIFNHLHQSGKQLILTSDKAPVDLQGVEQRLLSRFKWGLSADLQAPDLETRISILNKKMYNNGIELPDEIIEYIAYSITNNVRELEGALISILAQATLNKKNITLEVAKKIIDTFVRNTTHEISIEYIQKIVCDYFGLPIELMKSKTRKREVVQARQVTMFFAKNLTKSSLSAIGSKCGGKDHATVLHACRTVNNLMETDKKYRLSIGELQKKIVVSGK